MGFDYALVHLTYTIPPAIALTLLYFPLFTRLDLYKLLFLITVAVAATIPWDSYLIRHGIWSYPPNVIIGPTLWDIPLEEVFFFVIQTYNTTLIYLFATKAVLKEVYLVKEGADLESQKWKYVKLLGQMALGLGFKKATDWIRAEGQETYLGLILAWALPFLLLLWSLAYQLLLRLPPTTTLVPVLLPTLYLWVVDTLSLQRGTWVIGSKTKTGLELWPGLEIEEAIFFLLTNMLIVFGLVAFDNALAVLHAFPAHFRRVPALPSPILLVQALLLPASTYDDDRILGIQQSADRLKRKSRSFYLASSTFQGRLRIDLIILYSFCRVADDLIDNAASPAEAKQWVDKLKRFVDLSHTGAVTAPDGTIITATDANRGAATLFVTQNFPPEAHLTLLLLPTQRINKQPLDELFKGFDMDLAFAAPASKSSTSPTPIKTEQDLDLYSARVAGTVALMIIQLVLYHHPGTPDAAIRALLAAGHDMGLALQYTNIARDLAVDAALGRCYVPAAWLKKEKLTLDAFTAGLVKAHADASDSGSDDFFDKKVALMRARLLDRAFALYALSKPALAKLPPPVRAPMRVAVESYMQIARELRNPGFKVKHGRATVPKWKRVVVAWRALVGF